MIHHINIQITDRERTREWYERVLGADFLDRGPALNRRQLQLRLGTGEIHTSDTDDLIQVPRVHFAIEVEDFDATLVHLDEQGVPYTRTGGGAFTGTGGEDPRQGTREDTGERYTYISDPDGNLIELVYHPLGLESSDGDSVALTADSDNVRWTQISGFVEEAYRAEPAKV
jgi:catechol 2,3-dioxygenase-like lactoylglutathione lyase family enzyme